MVNFTLTTLIATRDTGQLIATSRIKKEISIIEASAYLHRNP
jgi:hypothetical protein